MGERAISGDGVVRRDLIRKAAAAGAVVWAVPVVSSTAAFATTRTACGSLRYTRLKRIKWHFLGGAGGRRTNAANFRSTTAYDTACFGSQPFNCPGTDPTAANMSGEANNGATNTNRGFTEITYSGNTSDGYTWTIAPPAGWQIVAVGGDLGTKNDPDGDNVCNPSASPDPTTGLPALPMQTGNGNVASGNTRYTVDASGRFVATGWPHWVELVIGQL